MKLLEIEIHNVRGLKDITFKPNGKNFVIWGPNGSGKSGVIDALDFLLTGSITRLTGKGTAGISLSKHGPHVDEKAKDAFVKAKVELPGTKVIIELKRVLDKPTELICNPKNALTELNPILDLAKRGQHVLTRRELLRYIAAEASSRAEGIQELLNLSEVEAIRKSLVGVNTEAVSNLKLAQQTNRTYEQRILAIIDKTILSDDVLLEYINKLRNTLNGKDLTKIDSKNLKNDLIASSEQTVQPKVNKEIAKTDLEKLRNIWDAAKQAEVKENIEKFLAQISDLYQDEKLLHGINHKELIEKGILLLDDSNHCPLCDTEWPIGQLEQHLKERLASATTATKKSVIINQQATEISKVIVSLNASINLVKEVAKQLNKKDESKTLVDWQTSLESIDNLLTSPIGNFTELKKEDLQFLTLDTPSDLKTILSTIEAEIEKLPSASAQQSAWDGLTRLEEALGNLEQQKKTTDQAQNTADRGKILLEKFNKARDLILNNLYKKIKDRFVELYKFLNSDEDKFSAILEPAGAGLKFEVDFYGRGEHPPHALHSEGHQDSMGVSLYLALAEHLTEGFIDLLLLDDVVMSVDAEHRKHFCRLLKKHFPNRQFVITTHDRTWATQLKKEGVIDSKNLIEFHNWNVDTGPQVNTETDIWIQIKSDLNKGNVADAAAKLRRGAEQHFSFVCEALQAPVPYRANAKWDLGDVLPAAIGQYKELLKKAKDTANSWNQTDVLEDLKEVDTIAKQIFVRTNAEQWAVNESLHYNNWGELTKSDFEPVVDAFKDLYTVFDCQKCGSIINVIFNNREPAKVTCNCSQFSWNLTKKSDFSSKV